MIPRPTTAQLLQQCRRELTDNIAGQLSDETALVALEQIQMVLDVCAHRTEHEIADLVAETAEMERLVRIVVDARGDELPRTTAALAGVDGGRTDSLLRSDLIVTYELAAQALSAAIEELMDLGDTERVDALVTWMREVRQPRELAALANWAMPGRG